MGMRGTDCIQRRTNSLYLCFGRSAQFSSGFFPQATRRVIDRHSLSFISGLLVTCLHLFGYYCETPLRRPASPRPVIPRQPGGNLAYGRALRKSHLGAARPLFLESDS